MNKDHALDSGGANASTDTNLPPDVKELRAMGRATQFIHPPQFMPQAKQVFLEGQGLRRFTLDWFACQGVDSRPRGCWIRSHFVVHQTLSDLRDDTDDPPAAVHSQCYVPSRHSQD